MIKKTAAILGGAAIALVSTVCLAVTITGTWSGNPYTYTSTAGCTWTYTGSTGGSWGSQFNYVPAASTVCQYNTMHVNHHPNESTVTIDLN